jgi:hypothetical protein
MGGHQHGRIVIEPDERTAVAHVTNRVREPADDNRGLEVIMAAYDGLRSLRGVEELAERGCDGLATVAGGVLVDHRRPDTGVPQTGHQLFERRATRSMASVRDMSYRPRPVLLTPR